MSDEISKKVGNEDVVSRDMPDPPSKNFPSQQNPVIDTSAAVFEIPDHVQPPPRLLVDNLPPNESKPHVRQFQSDSKLEPIENVRLDQEKAFESSPNSLENGQSQPPREPRRGWQRIILNAGAISGVLIYFSVWLILSILYILFIYFVLLQGNVQVGPVTFDASTSNLLVSIFSQAVVMLANTTITGIFSSIRMALAMRGDTSLITFLGIGSTSKPLSVFGLFTVGWLPKLRHRVNFPLLGEGSLLLWWLCVPIMGIILNSVLKYRATFSNTFVPENATIPIFGGLIPIDIRVVAVTAQPVLCTYTQMWIPSLLSNGQYSKSFPVDGCTDGCRSYIFPGGVDTARQVYPTLNYSLFAGNVFDNPDTIRINDAAAFITVYRDVEGGFAPDLTTDCIYGGQAMNDSLQLCVRQDGDGIIAGWAACPEDIIATGSCYTNLTWTTSPLTWATRLTAYKQHTTTTYSGQNLSIIDIDPTSPREVLPLKASDYKYIFQSIFLFDNYTNDQQMVSALVYRFTWIQRITRDYFFYDQSGPTKDLQNLLAIPLQFSINAYQFANFTPETNGSNWSMPDEALTSATAGRTVSRLVILSSTAWFFIGTALTLLLLASVGIIFILSLQHSMPQALSTGIGDIDILWWADRIRVKKPNTHHESASDHSAEQVTLAQVAKAADDESSWNLARRFRFWKVEVVGEQQDNPHLSKI